MANRSIITRYRGHGLLGKSYPLRHLCPGRIVQLNWFSLSWSKSVNWWHTRPDRFFWGNKRDRKYLKDLVDKNGQINLYISLWILVVWVITTHVSMFYRTNSDDLCCFVLIWLTLFQLGITAIANNVERFCLIIILAIFSERDHYHGIFTRLVKLPNHW